MYFVISAGGTAGHINPALAVADELKQAGHDILFVGTPDRLESKLAVDAGFSFVGLSIAGFDKARPWTLISSGLKLIKATNKVVSMFKDKRPDACLGFGAYVSIPVGRAAYSQHIPLIIHEQNSVPGMANKYLAKRADITALTYPASEQYMQAKGRVEVVGNPVRSSVEKSSRENARKSLDIAEDATVMLITGGSLGAKYINDAVVSFKDELLQVDDLIILHSTGKADYDRVCEQLNLSVEQQSRWKVFSYIENMGDCMAASDFILSRAGASSLAEIMTLQIPSVLIPYTYARGDHQTLNAQNCVKAGAACLVVEGEDEKLKKEVLELATNADKRACMCNACKSLSGSDARKKIAAFACELAQSGGTQGEAAQEAQAQNKEVK